MKTFQQFLEQNMSEGWISKILGKKKKEVRQDDIVIPIKRGKGNKIDDEDREMFTKDEIDMIKGALMPDTVRENLIADKKRKEKADWLKKNSTGSGGDSNIGSPVGSSSNNNY